MSLLASLAMGGGAGTPPAPGVSLPYPTPSIAPYNVDFLSPIPTPDGSGQTVHPDVVDFGKHWNGWRFWLAVTPYPGGRIQEENPCVYGSNDGYHWETPKGMTNPLDAGPNLAYSANSDTDLFYDEGSQELILTYRLYHTGTRRETFKLMRSADGVKWSEPVIIFDNDGSPTGDGGGVQQYSSQALVRVAEGDYRMWTCGATNEPDKMFKASTATGPWTVQSTLSFGGTGRNPYHTDVIAGPDGRFWMIGCSNGVAFASVSSDGVNWVSGKPILDARRSMWDSNIYRATIQPHEDGKHMRAWYSAFRQDEGTGQVWRTAVTVIPRAEWGNL